MKKIEDIMKDPTLSEAGRMIYAAAIVANSLQGIDKSLKRNNCCDMVKDMHDFHEKFDIAYDEDPRKLPKAIAEFRVKFLNEELINEYVPAVMKGDLTEQIDGLFDIIYVAMGTLYLMGVDIEGVWNEGHASNMSKELVPKGKGKYGGTIAKGSDYFKPNFKQFTK